MSRVENFISKTRYLVIKKNPVRIKRFGQPCSASKVGKPLCGSQQSAFQQGLWELQHRTLGLVHVSTVEVAADQSELNKEQKPLSMCLSLSEEALMRSLFHLPSQINQGSGLSFCTCNDLPQPVPTLCSASIPSCLAGLGEGSWIYSVWCMGETTKFSRGSMTNNFYSQTLEHLNRIRHLAGL